MQHGGSASARRWRVGKRKLRQLLDTYHNRARSSLDRHCQSIVGQLGNKAQEHVAVDQRSAVFTHRRSRVVAVVWPDGANAFEVDLYFTQLCMAPSQDLARANVRVKSPAETLTIGKLQDLRIFGFAQGRLGSSRLVLEADPKVPADRRGSILSINSEVAEHPVPQVLNCYLLRAQVVAYDGSRRSAKCAAGNCQHQEQREGRAPPGPASSSGRAAAWRGS